MSAFRERLVVLSRDNEATRNFTAFVSEHAVGDAGIHVALRLPINIFSDRRRLIERRVTATLVPLRAVDDASPAYRVAWASQSVQPFPYFTGELSVEQSPLDERIALVIDGLVAPLSEPPHAFDAIAGGDSALHVRIAHAAARDLLRAIAEFIENAAAHNAAARAGHYRRLPETAIR